MNRQRQRDCESEKGGESKIEKIKKGRKEREREREKEMLRFAKLLYTWFTALQFGGNYSQFRAMTFSPTSFAHFS